MLGVDVQTGHIRNTEAVSCSERGEGFEILSSRADFVGRTCTWDDGWWAFATSKGRVISSSSASSAGDGGESVRRGVVSLVVVNWGGVVVLSNSIRLGITDRPLLHRAGLVAFSQGQDDSHYAL